MPFPKLFHASEDPTIELFEPRPAPSPGANLEGKAVWAISESHLPNYLLPRECPRVTFAAAPQTSAQDREKFLSPSHTRVIAIEEGWLPRIEACQLYLYEFPHESFELHDPGAGYYISRKAVRAERVTRMGNLLEELRKRRIDVRILPNLWELRNAVSASTLEFSIIRFRNALAPANIR